MVMDMAMAATDMAMVATGTGMVGMDTGMATGTVMVMDMDMGATDMVMGAIITVHLLLVCSKLKQIYGPAKHILLLLGTIHSPQNMCAS